MAASSSGAARAEVLEDELVAMEEARSEEASDPKRFGWVPGIATTPRDAAPPAAAMV